jgi:hypothetical protein
VSLASVATSPVCSPTVYLPFSSCWLTFSDVTYPAFLRGYQYIIGNPDEREKLQEATAAEIVQAGKDAGYDFTISDLETLMQRFTAKAPKSNAGLAPITGEHNPDSSGLLDPEKYTVTFGCHDPNHKGLWEIPPY